MRKIISALTISSRRLDGTGHDHSRTRRSRIGSGWIATVDENIQAVLKEIKARPALLTAYLSAVINATNLPDPRRMDFLF